VTTNNALPLTPNSEAVGFPPRSPSAGESERCAALLGGTLLLRERGDSTVGSTGGKSPPAHFG
jgi:hypothetical protein